MKSTFTKITIMLALAITTLSINAAAQNYQRRHFKAAFAFTAGTTQLPAGEYTLEPLNRDSSSRMFTVRNVATNQQAIIHVTPTKQKMTFDKGVASFNRYDDQSFLSLINMGDTVYSLARSKAEREAEKQLLAKAKANGQVSEVRE
jgi:hypothetical protein